MINGDFTATSNEIIKLDARCEKQILDWSANEKLELDCKSKKTSFDFQIKSKGKLGNNSKGNDWKIC